MAGLGAVAKAVVAELWFPGAERLPGPARKTSGAYWPKKGIVLHSMEGSWAGSRAVLFGPRSSSWHFSILLDGKIYQHYAINVIAWHAKGGNTPNIGAEHEGDKHAKFTDAQVDADVELIRWLKKQCEWDELSRARPDGNMVEHQEIGIENNYVTLCPSKRPRWVETMARASKEDDMELQELDARTKQSSVLALIAAKALAGAKITQSEKDIAIAVLNALPVTD